MVEFGVGRLEGDEWRPSKIRTMSDHVRDQKPEEALEPSPVAVARARAISGLSKTKRQSWDTTNCPRNWQDRGRVSI